MNKITLIGRLGQEPELKTLESGKKLCSFSLATSKKYKEEQITQWHNIIFWEKQAEIIAKYVEKGDMLVVIGEVNYRKYTNKEGNEIHRTEIFGEYFEFLPKVSKPDQSNEPDLNTDKDGLPF